MSGTTLVGCAGFLPLPLGVQVPGAPGSRGAVSAPKRLIWRVMLSTPYDDLACRRTLLCVWISARNHLNMSSLVSMIFQKKDPWDTIRSYLFWCPHMKSI